MPRGSKHQISTLDMVIGNVIQRFRERWEYPSLQITRIYSNSLNYISGKVNQFIVNIECLYHFMLHFVNCTFHLLYFLQSFHAFY